MDNEYILIVRGHSFTYKYRCVFDLGEDNTWQNSCRERGEAYATSNFTTIKAQDTFCSKGLNITNIPLPLMGGKEASKPHKQAFGHVQFEMDEGFVGFLPEYIPFAF
jgi:hypothetical protein